MRLYRGVQPELEAEADRLIRESLDGVTRPADKADILTPWKAQDRRQHEIYVAEGVPDRANREGVYHRAINEKHSHLNSATPGSLGAHRYNRRKGSGS